MRNNFTSRSRVVKCQTALFVQSVGKCLRRLELPVVKISQTFHFIGNAFYKKYLFINQMTFKPLIYHAKIA